MVRARTITGAHGRHPSPPGGQRLQAYERGDGTTFTPTALRVAQLYADGMNGPDIAAALRVTHDCVKTYGKQLREGTNRRTLTGAVAKLIRQGLIR